MYVKELKRAAALTLSAVLALGNIPVGGIMEAFAESKPGPVYGEKGEDFIKVRLHGTGGTFLNALKLEKKDRNPSTPSDATPNDATPSDSTPSDAVGDEDYKWELKSIGEEKNTDFTVDIQWGAVMSDEEFMEAVENAELVAPDSHAGQTPVWMTEKGNFDSKINLDDGEDYEFSAGKLEADFYAGWFFPVGGNSTQISGVNAVTPDGVELTVTDLEELKTVGELSEALPEGMDISDISDTIQLDISLAEGSVKSGQSVGINIVLPDDFAERVTEGRDIAVIHFTKDGKAKLEKSTYDRDNRTVEFSMTSFSPVILAAVSETAHVTVENVPGAVTEIYSISENEDGTTTQTYVPIGEEVNIPAGTELQLRGFSINARLEGFEIDNEGTVESCDSYEKYTVKEGTTVITPVVKDRQSSAQEEEEWTYLEADPYQVATEKPVKYERQVVRIVEDGSGNFREISVVNARIPEKGAGDADLFTITADGKLTSKEALPAGWYYIELCTEYQGEEKWESVQVNIGSSVTFYMYTGHGAGVRKTFYTDYLDEVFVYTGTPFGEAEEMLMTKPAMFGGYEFAGWFEENQTASAIDEGRPLDEENLIAYARFQKDGNLYDPEIKPYDGTQDPGDNTDDPSQPSSSGRRGSGGSATGSSYSGGTIYGDWQQDAAGWRFRQTDGTYAANKWGRIDGTWYYFGADTYMVTGWFYDGFNWYYLNPISDGTRGAMKTGWVYDASYGKWFYLSASGEMLTGWQVIDGKYYYLNPVSDGTKGAMAAEQWVDDYYVNADGARIMAR